MEAVSYPLGSRKASLGNQLHVWSHIQSYLPDLESAPAQHLQQHITNRFYISSFYNGDDRTFPALSFFIDKNSIEFPSGKGYFINTDITAYVLFKEYPISSMWQLIPISIAAQMITVLTFIQIPVQTIELADALTT